MPRSYITAAGLRAGKPSVIRLFLIDQLPRGARVHALSAGPKPIPQKKLTADKLAAAITEATSNPSMRAKAQQVGRQIRDEDGIGAALAIIERVAGFLPERAADQPEPA